MAGNQLELRAFAFIDRMQPQYAAYVGTTEQGDIPLAGMSELWLEVAPGNEVFRLADVVLKSSQVRPSSLIVEREFGMLGVHGSDQSAVVGAGEAILQYLGVDISQRLKPRVASVQVITNIDPYQAQLINKTRRGSMLVPGETLLVVETSPAAYVGLAANEAEKAADLKVIDVRNVGRFGRMFMSGSTSNVTAGKEAAIAAIEQVSGRLAGQ